MAQKSKFTKEKINVPIQIIETQMEKIIDKMSEGLTEEDLWELAKRSIIEGMAFIRINCDASIEVVYPYEELETRGI